ncbi:MAG: hypothetical protein IPF47_18715 [Gemmatimonadetes bacterium]|nr:hypothetical protein [Gemmatimonadota bacterium]
MGPNFFSSREGAVLDVRCGDEECAPLLLAWRTEALELATRLGWHDAEAIVRPHPGGAQCFLSAPVDALLTATEVNERAWQAAECVVAGGVAPIGVTPWRGSWCTGSTRRDRRWSPCSTRHTRAA